MKHSVHKLSPMSSNEIVRGAFCSSAASSIIDSIEDEIAELQPAHSQGIGFSCETKNESSIQQSNVMIGSTINCPQTAGVNVHNHYYNTTSEISRNTNNQDKNLGNAEETPLLNPESAVQKPSCPFKCKKVGMLLLILTVLAVILLAIIHFLSIPALTKTVSFIPRKQWQKVYQKLPDDYLRTNLTAFIAIDLYFSCRKYCASKPLCTEELNDKWDSDTQKNRLKASFFIGDDKDDVYEYLGFDHQQNHGNRGKPIIPNRLRLTFASSANSFKVTVNQWFKFFTFRNELIAASKLVEKHDFSISYLCDYD